MLQRTFEMNGVELLCKFNSDGGKKLINNTANVSRIICGDKELKGKIGYNTFAHQISVRGALPWACESDSEARQWMNGDNSQLLVYIDETYGINAKSYLRDGLKAAALNNCYNPVWEYLSGLKWDGRERVNTLLHDCLGAEDNEYNAEAMKLFMRGAVARIKHPGCKFDYMLTLLGGQGIGKSSFLAALAHDRTWFHDNFSSIDGDGAFEKLKGKWLAELAELLATRKNKDVEAIKSFLTSQTDTFRTKYEQFAEDHPRCCVFAASTNNTMFLTDRTGNRRYLLIECGKYSPKIDIWEDSFADYIDQCWAEIMATEDGSPLVLSEEMQEEQKDILSEHEEEDTKVGLIQEYLDSHRDKRVCVPELILYALDGDYRNAPRYLTTEIHSIVQNCEGWRPIQTKRSITTTKEFGKQKCYEYVGH